MIISNDNNVSRMHLSLILLTAVTVVLSLKLPINDWTLTHWVFNYQDEFLKRGLIGTILLCFSETWTTQALTGLSIILFVTVSIMLLSVGIKFCNQSKLAFTLLTYLVIAPFTIQHMGFDLSRFDQFGLLFLLIFLSMLHNRLIYIVYLLIPLGILIHETFVFLFLPTFFALILIKYRENLKKTLFHSGIIILLSLTTFVLVAMYGGSDTKDLEQFNADLTKIMTPQINSHSALIYFRSLEDNITLTLDSLLSRKMLRNAVRFILVMGPFLFLLIKAWKEVFNSLSESNRKRLILCLLAQSSCFLLFFLGLDFFRWISALATCNLILLIYCLNTWQLWEQVELKLFSFKKTLITCLVLALLSGPMSIMAPFKEPFGLFKNNLIFD